MPLQSPLSAAFSPSAGRNQQNFSTRFASYPDRRLWQKKKARQLAFSPFLSKNVP
jgi:hypothetical protein